MPKREDAAYEGAVGRGAVLYDTRPPERRPCCSSEGGRCLWHVTNVYEDVDTGYRLYEVWDGTHTVREYVNEGDLLYPGMFVPAGWQCPVGTKPTYLITRRLGVRDTHDRMMEATR
jgi:hypothetical protein